MDHSEHHHHPAGCCPAPKAAPSCGDEHDHEHGGRVDWLLWGSAALVVAGISLHFHGISMDSPLGIYAHASWDLMSQMWWGVALGILFVGLLARIPRELVMAILGKGGTFNGILRACAGGVLLDLCSHGILLVGTKLYERGASLGQLMAFLIASPWNSFSLTLVMIALMGLKWTLAFMLLSMLIAIIAGLAFDACVARGILPANPHVDPNEQPVPFKIALRDFWENKGVFSAATLPAIFRDGMKDARMVLRWLLFGVVMAAAIRALVPPESFATYFGATGLGLLLTIIAATVIEVCSEGSTPIAADILTRAHAPGNSFAFLMAGVSTDYTEIMVLKDTLKSWKAALFLPLITLPQIILLAWILNQFSV